MLSSLCKVSSSVRHPPILLQGLVAQSRIVGGDSKTLSMNWLHQYTEHDDVEEACRRVEMSAPLASFSHENILHMPVYKFYNYLRHELPEGKYLIKAEGHYMSFVKNGGSLYLFDPEIGCVDLVSNERWFRDLLISHKVHLSEALTLYTEERADIAYSEGEDSPKLTLEKTKGRWQKASFQMREETFSFVRDAKTSDIYNDDYKNVVRLKCTYLALATPVVNVARAVEHVAKGIFSLFTGSFYKAAKKVKEACRLLFYGGLGTAASLYGIVNPYQGRRYYAMLERRLNEDRDKINRREKFYHALCFQPININADNKLDIESAKLALKKFVLWRKWSG